MLLDQRFERAAGGFSPVAREPLGKAAATRAEHSGTAPAMRRTKAVSSRLLSGRFPGAGRGITRSPVRRAAER